MKEDDSRLYAIEIDTPPKHATPSPQYYKIKTHMMSCSSQYTEKMRAPNSQKKIMFARLNATNPANRFT